MTDNAPEGCGWAVPDGSSVGVAVGVMVSVGTGDALGGGLLKDGGDALAVGVGVSVGPALMVGTGVGLPVGDAHPRWIADRAHPRDALAALLWPERPDASARKNLRPALTSLRRAIADERAAPSFLSSARDALQVNVASDHRLDVADFERLLTSAKAHRHRRLAGCTPCLESERQAVALYRGGFPCRFSSRRLPGVRGVGAAAPRGAATARAGRALRVGGRPPATRRFYAARQYAHRQLELDAWRDEAHHPVMIALAATGQRSAALAQFEQCRNVLQAELGVEPDEATLALHDQNRANTPRQLRRRRSRASSPSRAADAAAPTPEDPI